MLLKASLIAAKYAMERKQFSNSSSKNNNYTEVPIINYQLVYDRIVNSFAEVVAFRNLGHYCCNQWANCPKHLGAEHPDVKFTHALLSCSKPLITSRVQSRLQDLREVMGGNGYSHYSGIGVIRNISDVNTTWEGDNNVLYQQCGKYLISKYLEYTNFMKNSEKNKDNLLTSNVSKFFLIINICILKLYKKIFYALKNNTLDVESVYNQFISDDNSKLMELKNDEKTKNTIYDKVNSDIALLNEILKRRFVNSVEKINNPLELLNNVELWNENQVFNVKSMVFNYAEYTCYNKLYDSIKRKINEEKNLLKETNQEYYCVKLLLFIYGSNILLNGNYFDWKEDLINLKTFLCSLKEKYLLSLKIVSRDYLSFIINELSLPSHLMNNVIWDHGIKGLQTTAFEISS